MRRWGVTRDGDSLWWPSIGRNKRSIVLDLRQEPARQVAARLAEQCDVVLENFRPGQLDKWGLSYDELAARNPKVVMVHVSGFGQTGPLAAQAGFGSVGEAMGGIRYTTGSPDRPPSRAGISLGDALASVFAVIGTLAALVRARDTGKGQEVDVAIYEAVAALMESTMADFELGGVTRTRSGSVLPGRRAVERVPDRRRRRGRGGRQRRQRVRPPVRGDGPTRAGHRPALRDPSGPGREHGRARRARRRVDRHRAVRRDPRDLGRPRCARRSHLHRARHAHRSAVPRPRHGAAAHVEPGLGRADDRRRAPLHGDAGHDPPRRSRARRAHRRRAARAARDWAATRSRRCVRTGAVG